MSDEKPKATQRPDGEEVVEESVSHYKVERLANGSIRVRSGGHVAVAETYYKALRDLAEWQQEELEDLPDHLREDQWKSVYHDTVNPETEDVVANDSERIKESVIEDVASGETDISRSGAWLAEYAKQSAETEDELGRKVKVYKQWETHYER